MNNKFTALVIHLVAALDSIANATGNQDVKTAAIGLQALIDDPVSDTGPSQGLGITGGSEQAAIAVEQNNDKVKESG